MKKMAGVYLPSMHCDRKANGCFLNDRRETGGRFVYCAEISHH